MRVRASSRIRTCDLLITSELYYHCAIEAFVVVGTRLELAWTD